ncbi:hypothetical protein [Agrobacterium vitis]|uniref:hypothetical protein n=2 Tax=Agrobacterium vitis TaxID=373 RepID=UPI0012E87E9A|nr:hypothetical protein [Agrobacterium vitis]MVA27268.1 hypothetical protein [Agrobacterium vitis]
MVDKIAAYVMPTALRRDGESVVVSATLALRPIVGKAGDGLETFPKWVETLFSTGKVSATLRTADGQTPKPGVAVSLFKGHYAKTGLGMKAIDTITDIWKVLLQDAGGDFTGLRGALATSETDNFADISRDPQPKDMKDSASSNIADAKVPDILSVARNDLSHLITAERANSIVQSVKGATKTVQFQTGEGTWFSRPWSRSPTRLERLAMASPSTPQWGGVAAGSTPDGTPIIFAAVEKPSFTYDPYRYTPGDSGSGGQAELRDALVAERSDLDQQLKTNLKPEREVVDRLAQAARQLSESNAKTGLEELKKLRGANRLGLQGAIKEVSSGKYHSALDKRLATHVAAGLDDYGAEPDAQDFAKQLPAKERAERRWFALQGLPSLQRLLHLAIDVELTWPESDFAISANQSGLDPSSFVQIGVQFGAGPTLFTLTRIFLPADKQVAGKCWPCTMEELLEIKVDAPSARDDLRGRATIDQFDGIVDLEAWTGTGKDRVARFDVDCLDVISAAESEFNRSRAIDNAALFVKGEEKEAANEALESARADRKLRTAGLRIVDQWRGSVAVKEFIRAHDHVANSLDGLVLDADDLTTGFKLDVAARNPVTNNRLWTSLTDRRVTYGLPSGLLTLPAGVTLEKLINVFVGGKTSDETQALRRSLDGVTLTMPTRLLQNADSQTAFAEPVLSTWDGDPLSLECREEESEAGPSDLPLDLTFDLDKTGKRRPHRMRLGASYWLGARCAMMAGVSQTLENAKAYYENGFGSSPAGRGMALPASVFEVRRLLRFEWIDAPMLTVPWPDISEEFSKREGLDGSTIVVRSIPSGPKLSSEEEDKRRFGPTLARRVLFAPAVDLTFGHVHGVFDHLNLPKGVAPPTGVKGVAYDIELGGFPSFVPGSPVAETYITHRIKDEAGDPLPSGLAVYQPAGKGLSANGYYPDPAARYLVVAIRKGGRNGPYLPGDPIVVSLYPDHAVQSGPVTPGYPNAAPVVVTVKTWHGELKSEPLTYQTLLKRTGQLSWSRRVNFDFTRQSSGSAKAIEIELALAPGEDLELEAWCVPERAHLAAWFDAPESIALMSAGRMATLTPKPEYPLASATKTVARVREALGGTDDKATITTSDFVIRRSASVVDAEGVKEAARLLQAAMLRAPVPGIAAVRRLRAVHAVEKPIEAPAIAPSQEAWPLRLRRIREDERDSLFKAANWQGWKRTDDAEGATEIMIGGAALLNQWAVERLELRLSTVSPRARPIDDIELGRTAESRMRGDWGVQPDGSVANPTERLYGFRVDPQGYVTLKPEQIVHSRWRIDASDATSIDLLALSAAEQQKKKNKRGETSDRFFTDGTARRIVGYLAGTSRTARLIPERKVYPSTEQLALDERRRFAVKSRSGDAAVIETVSTVLRSTVRPLAVPPKSLLPAFFWKPTSDNNGRVREMARRTRIRIRIDRPWFTSGEDERLGLVVWPPNILDATPTLKTGDTTVDQAKSEEGTKWSDLALSQGRVARSEPLSSVNTDLIDLIGQNQDGDPQKSLKTWRPPYFTDEDLGPGGNYITRWGADPIHEEGSVSWFLHAGAFKDVEDWKSTALDSIATEADDSGILWPDADRYKPRLVENVLMPIPEREAIPDRGDKPDPTEDAGRRDTSFMLVSIVTYAPRFDVDMEQWYVDVEIDPGIAPDPFLRLGLVRFQPHANRRLQVSHPIAEWVQVTGFKRNVSLEVDEETWTATLRAEVPRLPTFEKEAPRTILRATLIERTKTESGVVAERVAREPRPGDQLGPPYVHTVGAEPLASGSWIAKFNLPPPKEGVSFAVLLEEVYVLPRATFDGEAKLETPDGDKGITDPALWQESGPRFAVRLEI